MLTWVGQFLINDLQRLGSYEIRIFQGKTLKYQEFSSYLVTQNKNYNNCARKLNRRQQTATSSSYQTFYRESSFTRFHEVVPNIL